MCSEAPINGALNQVIVRRNKMSLGTILLIVLILILVGVLPTWPHSRSWGYGPSGGIGLVLVILLVLLLLGRI
jgi:drug/metabolite transporter superfamily protein YnfA